MRFVPIKNIEQQAVLSLHRARQGFVKARTAQANQIRGMLVEYGIILPQGISHVLKCLPGIIVNQTMELPAAFLQLLRRLGEHLLELDQHVDELEQQIQRWHRENEASRRLAAIPGIGPITASALIASICDARNFNSGKELAAWLGLMPRQHSSGGKQTLLGISKRGDSYFRTLLIHGARSALRVAQRKTDYVSGWLSKLAERRHHNIAAVALANRNARIMWALLVHAEPTVWLLISHGDEPDIEQMFMQEKVL